MVIKIQQVGSQLSQFSLYFLPKQKLEQYHVEIRLWKI